MPDKEDIIDMLDEDVANHPDDYNEQFRAHESTPFQPPTGTQYSFKVSEKRWKQIFGK